MTTDLSCTLVKLVVFGNRRNLRAPNFEDFVGEQTLPQPQGQTFSAASVCHKNGENGL